MAAELDLGAELFEVEVTLNPAKRVVLDGAAIAQVDDRQPLGLDDLTAQPVVDGDMVASTMTVRAFDRSTASWSNWVDAHPGC